MKARWSYIQGFLFPWMREDNDPITEALGRLVTTLDVIGLEAFVPEPPRGPGRPPEDRRALARDLRGAIGAKLERRAAAVFRRCRTWPTRFTVV